MYIYSLDISVCISMSYTMPLLKKGSPCATVKEIAAGSCEVWEGEGRYLS